MVCLWIIVGKVDGDWCNKNQPALMTAIVIEDFLSDVPIIVFATKIERRLCVTTRADFFHKLNCYGCLIVINT
ncbi:MAG: hypothetical protein KAH64_04695, partial [Nitrosomonadaceae bacterium]|nr:hypothetical protein [Nitrosomonadaceae bacterium]